MDGKTASLVEKEMRKATAALNSAAYFAARSMTPKEFEPLKQTIGRLMGSIHLDVLTEIYKEHPDLTPKALRQ